MTAFRIAQQRDGKRRGVVAGCALALASGWNIANVGAVASDTARAYGITLATVGLLTTALFLTHATVQLPGGKAVDRFGATRTGSVGLLLIASGDAIALLAANFPLALFARAVTGLGTGTAFIAGAALLRESRASGFAQGMFGGIAVGAGGLAVATVPQMATWRAPYWSSLLLVTLGVGGLLLARDRSPGSSLPRTRAVFSGGLFADKRLYRLGLLFSCSYGVTVVIANWVTELLDHHSSLSHGGAAVVGSLTLLVSIVSRPLGGWILHKHSDRLRATVGVSLACGCLGTVALLVAQPTWLAVVGAILVGIGGGISFAPVFTAAALARPDAPAASIGLVSGLGNLMVLFGTPLAGLTFAMSGGGRIGFAVIAGCWLAALVLLPDRPTLGAR